MIHDHSPLCFTSLLFGSATFPPHPINSANPSQLKEEPSSLKQESNTTNGGGARFMFNNLYVCACSSSLDPRLHTGRALLGRRREREEVRVNLIPAARWLTGVPSLAAFGGLIASALLSFLPPTRARHIRFYVLEKNLIVDVDVDLIEVD